MPPTKQRPKKKQKTSKQPSDRPAKKGSGGSGSPSKSPEKPASKPVKKKHWLSGEKLAELLAFDQSVLDDRAQGTILIGLDEVGRGSLIGPIVAGACVLPNTLDKASKASITLLNDSKQMTAPDRFVIYNTLTQHPKILTGIGEADPDEINEMNVHYASLLALYRAYCDLCEKNNMAVGDESHLLLIDGRAIIPDFPASQQQCVIKGDGKSAVIAGGSVIAKHFRDTMVIDLAKKFPGYSWESNMGYPTPAHKEALNELGITPLHRKNYKTVQGIQQTLF